MIIVIEGIDGSGKSTLCRALMDTLTDFDKKVCLINEPGGTEMANEIRGVLLSHRDEEVHPATELMLYFAGRLQNIYNILRNHEDKIIIMDRFVHSTLAYQICGHVRHDLRGLYEQLYRHVLGDFKPDLAYYIDLDPEVALQRVMHARARDRMECMPIEFFHRCRTGFQMAVDQSEWDYTMLPGTVTTDVLVDHIKRDVVQKLK